MFIINEQNFNDLKKINYRNSKNVIYFYDKIDRNSTTYFTMETQIPIHGTYGTFM